MSEALEEAIELVREFPDDRQDAVALALLAYLAQADAQENDADRHSNIE